MNRRDLTKWIVPVVAIVTLPAQAQQQAPQQAAPQQQQAAPAQQTTGSAPQAAAAAPSAYDEFDDDIPF